MDFDYCLYTLQGDAIIQSDRRDRAIGTTPVIFFLEYHNIAVHNLRFHVLSIYPEDLVTINLVLKVDSENSSNSS